MAKGDLCITWKSKPPLEGVNCWGVKGDIDYIDGKLCFEISNGSHVKIDPEQLISISVAGSMDLDKYRKK